MGGIFLTKHVLKSELRSLNPLSDDKQSESQSREDFPLLVNSLSDDLDRWHEVIGEHLGFLKFSSGKHLIFTFVTFISLPCVSGIVFKISSPLSTAGYSPLPLSPP